MRLSKTCTGMNFLFQEGGQKLINPKTVTCFCHGYYLHTTCFISMSMKIILVFNERGYSIKNKVPFLAQVVPLIKCITLGRSPSLLWVSVSSSIIKELG